MKTLCAVILAIVVVAVTSESQDDSKQAFKCPVCVGIGDDKKYGTTAEEKCDNVAVYYACHQKDAVCVSTKTNEMVIRDCFSKKDYDDYIKPKCDAIKGCQRAMCEESGCKAALPEDREEEYEPTKCPVCIGMGENAEKDCDKFTTFFTCNDKEAVCVSIKSGGVLMRDCFNWNDYLDTLKSACEAIKGCESAMCMDSKCKAQLPSSAKRSVDLSRRFMLEQ